MIFTVSATNPDQFRAAFDAILTRNADPIGNWNAGEMLLRRMSCTRHADGSFNLSVDVVAVDQIITPFFNVELYRMARWPIPAGDKHGT